MDGAARFVGEMALFAVALPMAAVFMITLLGRRSGRDLGGLAVLVALLASGVGILGWPLPPHDAHHWVLVAVVPAAIAGLVLQAVAPARPLPWVGGVAAVLLAGAAWLLLAPLAGVWEKGALGPLSRTAWVVDPLAWALVAWLAVDHAERNAPRPAVLGALVLALTAGAMVAAMGETARIGQMLGAIAAACGALALVTWKWPDDVTLGHGGVAVVMLAFTMLLLYAHFYASAPRPGAGLALVVPVAALVAIGATTTLRGVLRVLFLALIPVAGACYLARSAEVDKAAEEGPKSSAEQDAMDMYEMY